MLILISVLILLTGLSVGIYYTWKYLIVKLIIGTLIGLRVSVYTYISLLRYRRNRIDLTTSDGVTRIQRINNIIDKLNGYKNIN